LRNTKIRTDKDPNYEWERDNSEAWITRKVDVSITDAGERLGVDTIIVNPPLICTSSSAYSLHMPANHEQMAKELGPVIEHQFRYLH
jgi:hypothetical protein